MLPLSRQGNHLVARREDGTVKAHAVVQRAEKRPQTWRRALARLTNDGQDMLECLYSLMHGNAYTPRVYGADGKPVPGKECAPIIPTPEVRRAAAMNLHEMLRGKAVAETEVIASEREAEKKLQLESMSDAQLQAYIDGEYKLLDGGEDTPEVTTPREDGDAAPETVDQGAGARHSG